jgi:hypothetical protein
MLPARPTGRRPLAVLLATAAAMAVIAPSAMADRSVGLTYTINGLPPHAGVTVTYDRGTTAGSDGGVQATSGSLYAFNYLSSGMFLFAGNDTTDVTALQMVTTDAATITGRAQIPKGTAVTVHDSVNNQTTTITNGPFSIPLSVGRSSKATGESHRRRSEPARHRQTSQSEAASGHGGARHAGLGRHLRHVGGAPTRIPLRIRAQRVTRQPARRAPDAAVLAKQTRDRLVSGGRRPLTASSPTNRTCTAAAAIGRAAAASRGC